jgi:hypothetical protein
VAAEVQVTPTQDQAGKEIRIVAFVIAHEPLTVSGRGKIRIGGEFRRLYPKGGQRDLTVDEGYAVKLRPTPKVARQIARALTEGQVLHASFTVTLTNEAGGRPGDRPPRQGDQVPRALGVRPERVVQLGEPSCGRPSAESAVWTLEVVSP